ncbi:MAG: TetR/AcrR family transcriptional regulator, partial [Candidatus Binatia bacterium]
GLAGVTIADVARRAGCGLTVAYYHFPDKRKLLLELVDEWGRAMPVERRAAFDIRTALEGAPRRAARDYLRRSYEQLRKGPSFFRVILAEADRDPEVRRRFQAAQQTITTWLAMMTRLAQQAGIGRADRDPDAAGYLMHHVMESVLADLVAQELPEKLRDQVLEELVEMICSYLFGDRRDATAKPRRGTRKNS